MLRGTKIVLVATVLTIITTQFSMATEPMAPEKLITRMDAVSIKIHDNLAAKFRPKKKKSKKDQGSLVEFYADREDKPVWVTETGVTEKARKLMAEIKNAKKYELDPSKFKLPNPDEFSEDMEKAADWLANTELKISYAALAYARHARGGRISPSSLSKFIDRRGELPDPFKLMAELSSSEEPGKVLAKLHPTHPQFKLLLEELRKARTQKVVEQVQIPDGPTLRYGDEDEQVVLLRKRLKVAKVDPEEGEFKAELFDEAVEEAVKNFQKAKGLKDDGVVGSGTRRILNQRPADRRKTILVNIERWRWMPRELGEFHIKVNIPEFKFRVIKNGTPIHTERTIVGKYTNQTPVFSDKMETVVFNPYWYPTYNIIRNEILPGARKSGRFIAKNGFEVTNTSGRPIDPESVDWYSARPRDFGFRQPPGAGNALGEVKFLFPNKHAVYLHDTPTKKLFNTSVRTYSHGCMRIRNPRRLAEIIMSNEGWSRDRVNSQIDIRENQHISLKKKFPVHVTYFTAWVNDDGVVEYHNDIYKHDKRIYAALHGLPVLPDPVDPVAQRARQQEQNIADGDFEYSRSYRRRRHKGFSFDNIFNQN